MLATLNRELRFEVKVILVFVCGFSVLLFIGSGNLSFEEARLRAENDDAGFKAPILSELNQSKKLFLKAGTSRCNTGDKANSDSFETIVEIGSKGEVIRSWRQKNTNFEICMQNLITQYFYFRRVEKGFFTIFSPSHKL